MSSSDSLSIEEIRNMIFTFSRARNWTCYWYPRNYILAFVGEFGELVELFEGLSESELYAVHQTKPKVHQLICEELSDVLLYVILFSGCAGFNLSKLVLDPTTADDFVDFKGEFPVTFDDGIFFSDLVAKIPREIQAMNLFDLVVRMARKISRISTVYQWLPHEQREISRENFAKLKKELSELIWYLVEVGKRFQVDVAQSIQKKMIKNAVKYPLPA